MKRREILITGTSSPNFWKKAEASNNKDIIECLILGVLIGLVFEDKLKVFGYDHEGELRSKCWCLPKDYKTTDCSVLEDLKLSEANQVLKEYFKDTSVEIKILEKTAA